MPLKIHTTRHQRESQLRERVNVFPIIAAYFLFAHPKIDWNLILDKSFLQWMCSVCEAKEFIAEARLFVRVKCNSFHNTKSIRLLLYMWMCLCTLCEASTTAEGIHKGTSVKIHKSLTSILCVYWIETSHKTIVSFHRLHNSLPQQYSIYKRRCTVANWIYCFLVLDNFIVFRNLQGFNILYPYTNECRNLDESVCTNKYLT